MKTCNKQKIRQLQEVKQNNNKKVYEKQECNMQVKEIYRYESTKTLQKKTINQCKDRKKGDLACQAQPRFQSPTTMMMVTTLYNIIQ